MLYRKKRNVQKPIFMKIPNKKKLKRLLQQKVISKIMLSIHKSNL
jgi:hypothetical protein